MNRVRGSAAATTPEAVIVAGGFGTRMLPLTERRPKHLLEVGGVPFLEHQIAKLAGAGVDHIVLATSYHAELFRPVLGDGERYGVRLTYVREEEPLGTAGALRNVASVLGDNPERPVVILNGDVLSGHDLVAQLEQFDLTVDGRPRDVSLHLVEVQDARAFGCVPTDDQGRVLAFVEKSESPLTNQVNAGCYIFRRRIIDLIPPARVVSVERETFPELVRADAVVVGYVETAYWMDVGTPEALVAASRDLVLGLAPSEAGWDEQGTLRDGAWVAATAQVEGTLSGGSSVHAGAVVATAAVVEGSVAMPGARLERGVVVIDSVIGPGAVVGSGVELRGVAVGDGAHIGSGARVAHGERIACGVTVAGA